MNNKVINKYRSLWYNKRHPWNLVDDLAIYLRDSIRGYILCLEDYGEDQYVAGKLEDFYKTACKSTLDKFRKENLDDKEFLVYLLKRMYYSFDQVTRDYPESPWNIWWEKNCAERSWSVRKDGRLLYATPSAPEDVRKAQRKYCDDIDAGIKLYAELADAISFSADCTYVFYLYEKLNKKIRNQQLKKIDPILNKIGAFGDDQAWYIYEGLVAFKNSERTGHPGYVTEEGWEKYLDAMIFTFHEIVHQNEILCDYDKDEEDYWKKYEEYWTKYNNGKKLFGKYFLDLWD